MNHTREERNDQSTSIVVVYPVDRSILAPFWTGRSISISPNDRFKPTHETVVTFGGPLDRSVQTDPRNGSVTTFGGPLDRTTIESTLH
jgi:hypothetical protein